MPAWRGCHARRRNTPSPTHPPAVSPLAGPHTVLRPGRRRCRLVCWAGLPAALWRIAGGLHSRPRQRRCGNRAAVGGALAGRAGEHVGASFKRNCGIVLPPVVHANAHGAAGGARSCSAELLPSPLDGAVPCRCPPDQATLPPAPTHARTCRDGEAGRAYLVDQAEAFLVQHPQDGYCGPQGEVGVACTWGRPGQGRRGPAQTEERWQTTRRVMHACWMHSLRFPSLAQSTSQHLRTRLLRVQAALPPKPAQLAQLEFSDVRLGGESSNASDPGSPVLVGAASVGTASVRLDGVTGNARQGKGLSCHAGERVCVQPAAQARPSQQLYAPHPSPALQHSAAASHAHPQWSVRRARPPAAAAAWWGQASTAGARPSPRKWPCCSAAACAPGASRQGVAVRCSCLCSSASALVAVLWCAVAACMPALDAWG